MSDDIAAAQQSVARLLRPRSVAILGVSADPGSMGGRALANLERFKYSGEIYLVSRTSAEVNGRKCLASVDDLPRDVDAVICGLPRQAVLGAVEACGRRGVGGMVVFAAGFAEAGEAGHIEQDKVTAAARAAGIALVGPNTIGLTNYVDNVVLAFGPNRPARPDGRPGIAVVAQSGAMMASVRLASQARQLAVTYAVGTGNEAVVGAEEILSVLVDDAHTNAIAVYVEQLRKPRLFLKLARRAARNGKPIILLHPGRSVAARDSAASHTGALSGDYATMRALASSEGVVCVDTLEEFMDTAEFLTRYPNISAAGPAVMTDSGAFRGLALDFAETIGLELPALAAATGALLVERLPDFASQSNPLDITAQGLKDMPLYGEAATILLADENCGSLLVSIMPGSLEVGIAKAQAILPALIRSPKPKIFVMMGGAAPVAPELEAMFLGENITFFRGPERAMRTLAHGHAYARRRLRAARRLPALPRAPRLPGHGFLAEYQGKEILRDAGIAIPAGGLARDADTACAIADRIGYPVVLKAQSAELPHKTEAGGVIIGLADEAALRAAWRTLNTRVAAARPGLELDGILVEAMGPKGIEMAVGARRDPAWGPVIVFGLGGIWIEVLRDVRLIPADLEAEDIIAEILQLKAAALLQGHRGAPPADLAALAGIIQAVGGLMRAHPEILEIDINPVLLYPPGQAPLALDALFVLDGAEVLHD